MSIEQCQRAVRELEAAQCRDSVAEASNAEFNRTFHKCRAEVTGEQWDMVWRKAVSWARANTITNHDDTTGQLLAVLQAIVRAADGRTIPGNMILDENSPLIDAARAAIAKAAGEQS